jgi:hypothetical protein
VGISPALLVGAGINMLGFLLFLQNRERPPKHE